MNYIYPRFNVYLSINQKYRDNFDQINWGKKDTKKDKPKEGEKPCESDSSDC